MYGSNLFYYSNTIFGFTLIRLGTVIGMIVGDNLSITAGSIL